ncbi:dihydropteroate synthase [Aurantiacibacter marinus]|uniref:dihydropteroate synthase n=1 Tax=Aurantiacibacter marinus TaxID=874156 RepID=A0A0H0XMN7_9SPHN|nr:dihydropteroate synthase [Aurantiacibacter marinus]KLI63227.1 dihydropteroate synthase [Aurantiacibacter marinus]
MTDRLYVYPISTVSGPQAVEGDAVRLAGGMVYAREFAVIVRREGQTVSREVTNASGIADAFAKLPADLGPEAEAQWSALRMAHPAMELGDRTIRLDQPQVMGILNVTPDSFSDGGKFMDDPEEMQAHAAAMHEAGAAIIDIGGESTRPGAKAIWEGEEIERVRPAVAHCAGMGAVVSIDTRRPAVMEASIEAGARIINDVSALRYDPRSLEFAASSGAPVILMHAPGSGEDLHAAPDYTAVAFDVFDFLKEARDRALAGGISQDRMILDPGIGFGKTLADNLSVLNHLPMYHALGCPLLLGASRKRMIGALSNEAPAHQRAGGSLALAQLGMDAGVQLLRVHDVFETVQARNVWRGLRDAALTDFGGLPD